MRFLTREQYSNYILKQGMKYLNECYFFLYSKSEEYDIVECLSKYTHNFLILYLNDVCKIKIERFFCYFVNKQNCQDICREIFNEHEPQASVREDKQLEEGNYIVFIRSKYKDIYSQSVNIRKFQVKYMIGKLNNLHHIGCDYVNGWAIPKLGDYIVEQPYTFRIIDERRLLPDNSVIISPLPGIGDYMMFFSIYCEYFGKEYSEKKYIATFENRKNENQILDVIFPEIPRLYFDNENIFNYYMKFTNTKKLKSLFFTFINGMDGKKVDEGFHITDLFLENLGLDKTFDKHKYSDVFIQRIWEGIDRTEKDYIDEMLDEKKYVGLQFFTGTYDPDYDVWITDSTRNWSEEHIKEFVDFCNKNGINIVMYGRSPYDDFECKVIEGLSTIGYIYSISKLSMTVGIDSSLGHIASIYDIPNITIWGKQTPFELDGLPCSFRTLSKNVSIYSERKNVNNITPEYLLDKMLALLKNEIELDEGVIAYDDYKTLYVVE